MRRYGVIGCPLGHSASAEHFTRKFDREGLDDCRYDLFELASIDALPHLLKREPDLCGFNVTIPYKQAILPYLDSLSDEAQAVGAVNCVRREGVHLSGYNTDVEGLRAALAELLNGDQSPETALVLGTGGASHAVQYVLAESGIGFDIVSRDPTAGNFTYDNLPCDEVASHRLIINASPVGMFPHTEQAPRIPYAYVTPSHYLLDLVYNPAQTQFMEYGLQRGAHVAGGATMFRVQAEASWRIWSAR